MLIRGDFRISSGVLLFKQPEVNSTQRLGVRRGGPSRWFLWSSAGLFVFLCLAVILAGLLVMRRGMLARRGQIVGSSMEPTLRGPRVRWSCPECGFVHWYAMDAWRGNRELICPSCDANSVAADGVEKAIEQTKADSSADAMPSFAVTRSEDMSDDQTGEGEMVEYLSIRAMARLRKGKMPSVDTHSSGLTRGDIVVVQEEPNSAREVKRLLAFPGEKATIRSGDIWIDGSRYQKSLTQLLRQAVLVGSWQPENARPHPWVLTDDTGLFRGELRSSKSSGNALGTPRLDEGARLVESIRFENRRSKIKRMCNELEVNAHDSHLLIPVDDVGIAFRVADASTDWQMRIALDGAEDSSLVEISVQRDRVDLKIDGHPAALVGSPPVWIKPLWVVVARVDGALVVGTPDVEWVRRAIDSPLGSAGPAEGTEKNQVQNVVDEGPLPMADAEGKSCGGVRVVLTSGRVIADRWLLFRDLHYRGAADSDEQTFVCEGALLLGDNVSTSSDGRTRWPGGLELSKVRGVVVQPTNPLDSLLRQAEQ